MQIGVVGLGKMGGNIARRLMKGKHEVSVFDLNQDSVKELVAQGAKGSNSLEELVKSLPQPRTLWIMVPAGDPVDATIEKLLPHLDADDTLVEGGNSDYRESMRRAELVAEKQVNYLDVGTSGGVWGLENGYAMMIGGKSEIVERHRPAFECLAPAPDKGWNYMGPNGAGHFVKMVHNGIEYGLMQAYAEGFALMKSKEEFGLDMHKIAKTWQHGSVVRSWLLDLTVNALEEEPELDHIAAYVPDSGMGRMTVREGVDQRIPLPVITAALYERFQSRIEGSFAYKMLSALRNQFGGHAMKSSKKS